MKKAFSLFSTLILLMHVQAAAQVQQDSSRQSQNPRRFGYLLTDLRLSTIYAVDKKNTWILGDEGDEQEIPRAILLQTSDGGTTWNKQFLEPNAHYSAIHFIDARTGWIAGSEAKEDHNGQGLVLKTTDGGKSWSRRQFGDNPYWTDIQFIDKDRGWILGSSGQFLRTSDGGNIWHAYNLKGHGWVDNEFKGWINSFHFRDKLNGWIVGDEAKAYQSTDAGISWKYRGEELKRLASKGKKRKVNFLCVKFINHQTGFIIADVMHDVPDGVHSRSVLLRTENGGQGWVSVFESENFDFRDLSFISDKDGWIMTMRGGVLLRTEDGGKTWLRLHRMSEEFDGDHMLSGGVWSLRFVDEKTAWLLNNVNDFALLDQLLYTGDGGNSWTKPELPAGGARKKR